MRCFTGTDGRSFVLGVGTEALWTRLVSLLGEEENLGQDPRFATNAQRIKYRSELLPVLRSKFAQQPAEVWLSKLAAAKIPSAAIQSVPEALDDPQTRERALIVEIEHPLLGVARSIANPVRMSQTPPVYRLPPPLLGEHTDAILAELGLTPAQVEELRREGAI